MEIFQRSHSSTILQMKCDCELVGRRRYKYHGAGPLLMLQTSGERYVSRSEISQPWLVLLHLIGQQVLAAMSHVPSVSLRQMRAPSLVSFNEGFRREWHPDPRQRSLE